MQVKSIAGNSAIISTFIKIPFVIKIFVLSIFECPFIHRFNCRSRKVPWTFSIYIVAIAATGSIQNMKYVYKVAQVLYFAKCLH